ncbi:MAG: OmpA family protein, partial [Ferruginibacter sp.]|nr:OmpA family protein [Cytophagales bacterium]
DLSYRLNTTQYHFPAYTLFIEKKISPTLGIQLNGTLGKISGNDRTQNWQGNPVTDNPTYGRALNFQTDVRSASLLLTYHFDNGRLLGRYVRLAPFLFVGVGVTDFAVYGDLFYANGSRYFYWQDNTIRNLPEGSADASRVEQDGEYETKLTGLATEEDYPTTVLSIPAGVGLKWKLANRLSLSIQAGITYAFTDYLDDVSGNYPAGGYDSELQAYAANPSGVIRQPRGEGENNRDWYFASSVTLNYHFGYRRKNFKAPLVYTPYRSAPRPVALNQAAVASSRPNPADTVSRISAVERTVGRTAPVAISTPDSLVRTNPERSRNAGAPDRNQAGETDSTAIPYSAGTARERIEFRSKPPDQPLLRDPSRTDLNEPAGNAYPQSDARSRSQNDRDDAYRYRILERDRYPNDRVVDQTRSPVYVPLPAFDNGRNDRTPTEQRQLQDELNGLRVELNALRAIQQPTGDPVANRKLDSLLTLVNTLENQSIRARYGADTLGARADSVARLTTPSGSLASGSERSLVEALRNQVDNLNQSMRALQNEALARPGRRNSTETLRGYQNTIVYFDVNQSILKPGDKQRLTLLANKLNSDPAVKLNVKGFADATGNPEYNLRLSEKRAESIVAHLTRQLGVDGRQILVNYYGVTGSTSRKSDPYQRRVELELFVDE